MLKGQDIVVLAALMDQTACQDSYAELGRRICLSASEAHASVGRLREAMLLTSERSVFKRNAIEFLLHGLRYAFPLRSSGTLCKGMATSYAAPVAEAEFASTGLPPVWSTSNGPDFGQAYEPLYVTAPAAAAKDRKLYDRLAVLDMLRGGRIRERNFAGEKLREFVR